MNSWNQFLEFLAKVDGEYVESVDWFGLLSKTKEELVAKERELSDKAVDRVGCFEEGYGGREEV